MGVSGHHGVNGVLAASHVTKGDNLGIELVSRLPNALMVKVRNRNLVILTNAQASTTSMLVKWLSRVSCSYLSVQTAGLSCCINHRSRHPGHMLKGFKGQQVFAKLILRYKSCVIELYSKKQAKH